MSVASLSPEISVRAMGPHASLFYFLEGTRMSLPGPWLSRENSIGVPTDAEPGNQRRKFVKLRTTIFSELSIRLCHRAPWVCYKANQQQRSRDAGILRITSLGYATEPTSYRGAHIMVIDKKGHQHQHQQQHQQHEPGVSPRAKTCLDLPTTRYQDIR